MRIEFDPSEVTARLKVMQEAMDTEIPKLIKESASVLSIDMRDNFESGYQGSKFGSRWAPLKASTVRDKARKGFGNKPILVRTGRLKASIRPNDVRKESAEVGSFGVDYAIYHQVGTRKMARRKIVGISKTALKHIEGLVDKLTRKMFYK